MTPHVAVVGGGLAGLAAAVECAERGAQVTLLERRNTLGGLTRSFRHNGMWVDNGQHVYLRCCEAYQAFTERIGAAGDLRPPAPLDLPVVAPPAAGGSCPTVGRLRRSRLPVPLHLAASLLRYAHLPVADRLALGRAVTALRRLDPGDPRLDGQTFGSWLAAHGQSPAAVAAVWDLITVPTVNLPADQASLATAAMVFKTALLTHPAAADIGWSRAPLGQAHGGRAAAALGRLGATVHTGTRVVAVRQAEAGWEVLLPGGAIHCNAVVVALPHEEAAAVLAPGTVAGQERWAQLGESAVVDVHLVFDRKVTGWPMMAAYRSPVQWVFDRTEASGLDPRERQYLAVSFSAAADLVAEKPGRLIDSTESALRRLLPGAASARVVDALVTKERRATFRASPGSAALRPAAATARPGLALAGAWTSTGWPATMEGAVRSGWAAAAACLEPTGRARAVPDFPPTITEEVA